jgi:hypothetical protein
MLLQITVPTRVPNRRTSAMQAYGWWINEDGWVMRTSRHRSNGSVKYSARLRVYISHVTIPFTRKQYVIEYISRMCVCKHYHSKLYSTYTVQNMFMYGRSVPSPYCLYTIVSTVCMSYACCTYLNSDYNYYCWITHVLFIHIWWSHISFAPQTHTGNIQDVELLSIYCVSFGPIIIIIIIHSALLHTFIFPMHPLHIGHLARLCFMYNKCVCTESNDDSNSL